MTKCKAWKLFVVIAASACALAAVITPLSAADKRILRTIDYNDLWYYRGETVHLPGRQYRFGSGSYCNYSFCPDGYGEMNTDAGWQYEGRWVEGRAEGYGELSNDFFDYIGGFKQGYLHGHGVLTCYHGTSYEGTFVHGMMTGEFKVRSKGSSDISMQEFGGTGASFNSAGPCPW
jgi:MORN repeat